MMDTGEPLFGEHAALEDNAEECIGFLILNTHTDAYSTTNSQLN